MNHRRRGPGKSQRPGGKKSEGASRFSSSILAVNTPKITSLPVEVLSHIFRDDDTPEENPYYTFMLRPHRATLKPVSKIAYRVCRHWRNIIRNNSAFCFISFTFNDFDDAIEMNAMKSLISRYQDWANSSPSADVDVIVLLRRVSSWIGEPVIVDRSEIIGCLIDFLVSIAHRWRLFTFEATRVSDYDLLNKALNVRAAQVGTLLPRLLRVNIHGDQDIKTSMDSIAKFTAPNLENFRSQDLPTNTEHLLKFTSGASKVDVIGSGSHKILALHLLDCMTHLEHLTLDSERVCYETSLIKKPVMAEFGWQSLQRLTLHLQPFNSPDDSEPSWPRDFPNVNFVHLIQIPLSAIKLFFSSFKFPSLRTLVLQHMAYVAPDSTDDIWRKADDVYPKIIRLIQVESRLLDFVIRSLAKSAEELLIERIAEASHRIRPGSTRASLLTLRKLSFQDVSWTWVKWLVVIAKFQDLEIFRCHWSSERQDIFCDTGSPALLLTGQSRLREIHLLDFHEDRGGSLLSQLTGPSFHRLSLDFAEARYVSQDWSHFCETNKQILLQVNDLKLAIPGGVYTSTRANSGDFSLAAFSNVVRLSLDLTRAKDTFLQRALQPSEGVAMPNLRSLSLRLEIYTSSFLNIMDLLKYRKEHDMALLELIISSFTPIDPDEMRRLDDKLNFFTFNLLKKQYADPLWE